MLSRTCTSFAAALACAALASTGCSSEDLPINGDGSAASALLVARWDGYVENYMFPSGSDAVRLDITSVQGSEIHGTVRFGDGPLLPPATDPNVGYPPGLPTGTDALDYAGFSRPYEGFDFTIHDAQLTEHRLRFSISSLELWKGWCELQTPVPLDSAPSGYGCLPSGSWDITGDTCKLLPVSKGPEPVDCGVLELCLMESDVCTCDAMSCTATTWDTDDFDLMVEQDQADGSVVKLADSARNVHLTRSN